MQTMAKVLNGTDPEALAKAGGFGFDPEFACVYRNNSVSALYEVLAANYMSILDLVGEDFFTSMVRTHVKKYPARQRTLVSYGGDFIKTVDKAKAKHKLPYLGDFVRLDRAWTLAHVASDKPALALSTLTKKAELGVELEAVTLTLMPGVSLLKLSWSVFDTWEKIRDEQKLKDTISIEKEIQFVLVWRYQNKVTYRILHQSEYKFLSALQRGDPLGVAMNSAMTSEPDDQPGHDFTTLLPNAIGADLFVALDQ